jgi:DNA helicase HerA-like ATPase
MTDNICIGTVVSDSETPTFEIVRIKLKANQDVRPGTILRIPAFRNQSETELIGRVRSAYEHNPNESAENINARETLQISANYPQEQDSTIIFRQIEADLIEEIFQNDKGETDIRSPQTLPNSGAEVFLANDDEIVASLGLTKNEAEGLHIGKTVGGKQTKILIKREAIQRHMFICGTTGSGKSYSLKVVAEELNKQGLPVIFIDTQDEYSSFVKKLGGKVLTPGTDFNIRISSLTDRELLDLVPTDSELHRNIIAASFLELQDEIRDGRRTKFLLQDLLDRMAIIGPNLTQRRDSVDLAIRRTATLQRDDIFGEGFDRTDWRKLIRPCLAVKCKHLSMRKLQTVATALLREFQNLRLQDHIPPYVMVVDEAHLFVPQGETSPCKQIIREGVRIGRHHGICFILLTQSPVDIDKSVIRQCNTRLVFALEPDQLDAIRGVKADASEEMLRALPKQPRGTCLLSGTYETVKHTIPVAIRQLSDNLKSTEGGSTPDIFSEMQTRWSEKQN